MLTNCYVNIPEPIRTDIIKDIEDVKFENVNKDKFILHAGGVTPNGIVGSNSLEAVEYSYENGYRVLEIDFCWTEDNYLVCVHDWDAYYAHRLGKKCVSLEEFEDLRFGTYGFTSFTLDHLCEWLKEHKDVIIVTDIKENCIDGAKLIAEKYPELIDNFYIQIYNKSDYEQIHNLGFDIIWTLYQLSWNEKNDIESIKSFVNSTELVGLTFSEELIDLIPNYDKKLLELDIPLFVHTVNDYNSQTKYLNMGITGIYTDFGEAKMVDDWKVK